MSEEKGVVRAHAQALALRYPANLKNGRPVGFHSCPLVDKNGDQRVFAFGGLCVCGSEEEC